MIQKGLKLMKNTAKNIVLALLSVFLLLAPPMAMAGHNGHGYYGWRYGKYDGPANRQYRYYNCNAPHAKMRMQVDIHRRLLSGNTGEPYPDVCREYRPYKRVYQQNRNHNAILNNNRYNQQPHTYIRRRHYMRRHRY